MSATHYHRLMPTARKRALVIGVALAASSGWSRGAEQPEVPSNTLPTVTVQGQAEGYKAEQLQAPQRTAPLRDTAQTITVVPQEVIRDQQADNLRDVLRNVPGISIQAGEGGTPPGDQMSIRGFSARTDIFVDGVRDLGGYSRDPFNLEQVEVSKGPASSYTGRGSTGGAINLVSKTAQQRDFVSGSLGLGTDEYQRTTLDVNRQLNEHTAARLNLMQHEQNVAGRDEVFNERTGIAPTITFGLDTDTRLTLAYFHMKQDNMPDYGIPWVPDGNTVLTGDHGKPAPVDDDNFYGLTSRDYEDLQTDLATVILEHDFSDRVTLRNLTRYGRTHRDFVATAPRFVGNNSTDIRRSDVKSRDQIDEVLSNHTDVTTYFSTGSVSHALVTGVEFTREEESNRLREPSGPDSPDTDLYNPRPGDPYTDALVYTGEKNESTAKTAAAYVGDTLEFSEHWQLNLGARYDLFKVDYKTGGQHYDSKDEMLSWRTGLVFKPRLNGSIYLGYGVSYNPSAEGLTLSTGGRRPATINLDPEESRSLELGTKWDLLNHNLLLNAALFRTDKTNARTYDDTDPNAIYVLDGEQRVQGVELGAVGRLTRQWQVYAGYTFMDSEVLNSQETDANGESIEGNELGNTPRNTFNLWSTYQITPRWQVGGGAQFVDERFSNEDNSRVAPDFWVYSAMAAWQVDDHFTVRLNLKNLTDEDYIDRVGGGHVVPGQGRLAIASLDFRF